MGVTLNCSCNREINIRRVTRSPAKLLQVAMLSSSFLHCSTVSANSHAFIAEAEGRENP